MHPPAGGHQARPSPSEGANARRAQEATYEHLTDRILWFLEADDVRDWAEVRREAKEKKFAYNGEVISVRRELLADKVIPTWPQKGSAAVADIAAFLDGDLRKMYEDPYKCMLPREEWPETVHSSRVYATQPEWDRIAREALDRGIFGKSTTGRFSRRPRGFL